MTTKQATVTDLHEPLVPDPDTSHPTGGTTMTTTHRPDRRRLGTIALVMMLLGGVANLATPSPAGAATVAQYHVAGTGGSGISARLAPVVQPGTGYGAAAGAVLNVQCQVLGEPFGPRGNKLYFLVNQGGRVFYAPDYYTDSPHLAAQPPIAGIPMCGGAPQPSTRADRAVAWARSQVGRVYASATDAAPYADWAPGPYGEWSGDCIKFANRAWAVAGVSIPRGNAINVYYAYRNQGRVHTTGTPPAGALVFWNISYAGHVAVSVGGGQVIGTRGMDFARLAVAQYSVSTYGNYLGWVMPG